MPISPIDHQLLLIQQVGDVDVISGDPVSPLMPGGTGVILLNAERLWNMYSDMLILPPPGESIFDDYFKRDAVQLVIAVLESRVDFAAVSGAMSVKLGQRIQARLAQQARFQAEIERLEERLMATSAPQIGLIKRVEPIEPPLPGDSSSPLAEVGKANPFVLDANDPRFSGSPYWPLRFQPSRVRG